MNPKPIWTTTKGTVIWITRTGVLFRYWLVNVQRAGTDLVEFYGGKHPTKEAAEKAANKLLEIDI